MIDIRDLIHDGRLIEESMNISYKAADEIAGEKIEIPTNVINIFKQKLNEYHIFLNDDDIICDIISGIIRGNIVLQGPPGTGKTAISKVICDTFNVNQNIITAIEDWTSYDTIGGLFPTVDNFGHEVVAGRNGLIVKSIVDCCNTITKQKLQSGGNITSGGDQQATWLVVDELNRAEIDKVFGELFTVFGSSDSHSEKKLSLWFHQDAKKKELAVPDRFRIIGTMNNVDKQFVNDMSSALLRRFTFISILPPAITDFDQEMQVIRDSLANRIVSKISKYETQDIDEAYLNSILSKTDFVNVQNLVYELLKHVRYEDDGINENTKSEYLGLQIGSAQIKDLFEATVFKIIIQQDTSLECIQKAFDSSFSNTMIPLMLDHSVERMGYFKEYFDECFAGNYSWMKKSKKSLELI